jgi:hypothetical protein
MSQAQLARGCQFGKHGEPFLWHGSGNDGVDIAIMQLINLAKDNPRLAHEAAEFVDACVKDAAQQGMHPTRPQPAPSTCKCGSKDGYHAAWCN